MTSTLPPLTAFEKDGVKIVFSFDGIKENNSVTINVTATNESLTTLTDFLFQAAVPKVNYSFPIL